MNLILAQFSATDSANLQKLVDMLEGNLSPVGFGWGLGTAITFWGGFLVVRMLREVFSDRDE